MYSDSSYSQIISLLIHLMLVAIRYSSLLVQVHPSLILFLSPSFLHILLVLLQEHLPFYSKLLSHSLIIFISEQLPLLISFIYILVLFLLLKEVGFEKVQAQLSFFILLVL